MKPTNPVFTGIETTVFETMSRLAMAHDAVNLGQGFPDVDGPRDILEKASETLLSGPNQYPPMLGLPELRQAVAAANKAFYGLDDDWASEVLVTSGATEALNDCLMALVEPGDEVILIEPLYDCYLPLVKRAGGIPVRVRVTPPAWDLNADALAAAFNDNTKAILINNPMNPTAKVFTQDELQLIADLCKQHDVYAICDEVYEHLVFDGAVHRPLMTFDGMRERSVRIGSAGKTFSLTGWKVGYVTGPAHLIDPIAKAHQFVTFTTPPNLQKAVAYGLGKNADYYDGLAGELAGKRDRMARGLEALGFGVLPCAATYFLTCDISGLGLGTSDVDVCRKLVSEAGVAAVPVSAFYGADAPGGFIRFCFCKRDEVIDEALARLASYLSTPRQSASV
ncbi:aspartate/methionine/tyrosine aminotransferase [Roseibium hamelinense]|uniref:Aspartate/methionine/tyrosine aminotransferase n=1 Tax=Roseibium hamelinense TaxID=150831 RepID=A0A562TI41_9HYPH|nr:aminotransferase [Roseibium hamelinense]MTI42623.1 aminotransferase [Roseibium hamelinense]TWI93369.1 aspartate/methionine/tyrosine aminotransferase [Roseibium hamelinense]